MLNNETPVTNGKAPMIFDPAAFKAKRRSLGWTQKRASEWFGLSAPAIGHWETGDTVPIEKNWAKIMEFMELGNEQLPVPVAKPQQQASKRPAWCPNDNPEYFYLRRAELAKLRIKGWWLGSAEGQSPNGSHAEANLFVTERGRWFLEVYYTQSGKGYLTHGEYGYLLSKLDPLPWARRLVAEKAFETWEEYDG
jgi:hypothetical protein